MKAMMETSRLGGTNSNSKVGVKHHQGGAVLIIGLILLVVLAMIGLAGMQSTTQQERMAGNLRDRNVGFQAAESALRVGEQQVQLNTLPMVGAGFYDAAIGQPPPTDADLGENGTWTAPAFSKATTAPVHGTAAAPAYIIEQRPAISGGGSLGAGEAKDKEVFKVSAWGVGASTTSVVVVQSTFAR